MSTLWKPSSTARALLLHRVRSPVYVASWRNSKSSRSLVLKLLSSPTISSRLRSFSCLFSPIYLAPTCSVWPASAVVSTRTSNARRLCNATSTSALDTRSTLLSIPILRSRLASSRAGNSKVVLRTSSPTRRAGRRYTSRSAFLRRVRSRLWVSQTGERKCSPSYDQARCGALIEWLARSKVRDTC